MKKMLALLLAAMMVLSLAACGAKKEEAAAPAETPAEEPAADKALVYAVEAGSAGEAAALDNGFEINSVDTQAKALMEVQAGTSDAAIIDSLMAGAMVGEGTSYPNLVYTLDLNEANGDDAENYVVGFRKDSDLTAAFNDFYKSAYEDGTVEKLAETYGVQEAIVAP